jgi:hypothetical protein
MLFWIAAVTCEYRSATLELDQTALVDAALRSEISKRANQHAERLRLDAWFEVVQKLVDGYDPHTHDSRAQRTELCRQLD